MDYEPTEEERALAVIGGPSPATDPQDRPGGTLMTTEIQVGGGWSVKAYFDASDAASLDIVALVVVPTSKVPPGGLTGEVLERIRFSELRESFLAQMALYQVFVASGAKLPDEGDQQEEFLGSIAAQLPTEKQLRRAVRRLRPSKKGPRSDEEKMADVATRFLEAQERDPQRALREMELQYFRDGRMDKDGRSIPYTKVRNWVHQATEDGWLTGQGQGKRGKVPGPKLLEYAERNRPTERKG